MIDKWKWSSVSFRPTTLGTRRVWSWPRVSFASQQKGRKFCWWNPLLGCDLSCDSHLEDGQIRSDHNDSAAGRWGEGGQVNLSKAGWFATIGFHLMNHFTFVIETFPWLMITSLVIYFDSTWMTSIFRNLFAIQQQTMTKFQSLRHLPIQWNGSPSCSFLSCSVFIC